MKHPKKFYQLINVDGFKWAYYDHRTKLHTFIRKEGFKWFITKASDDDIEDGNLKDMIELGVSK